MIWRLWKRKEHNARALIWLMLSTTDWTTGKALRGKLKRHGVRLSGPRFYQIMGRLEAEGAVHGRYRRRQVGRHIVRIKEYQRVSVVHGAVG